MKTEKLELLVGTFAKGASRGIYKLTFDSKTGDLGDKTLLVAKENPGFLHISKDKSRVYAANSTKPGTVSVFGWNEDSRGLNLIGDHPSGGDGVCYVASNTVENLLAVANYGSGSIAVYQLDESGNSIGAPQCRQHHGHGPHENQKTAHPHCVKFNTLGTFLYVADLGTDEIIVYPIDSEGSLGEPQRALKLDPGDGPRHLIFHPSENFGFIINELSSTVVSVRVDPKTGGFQKIAKESTLPAGYKSANACADIHLNPEGTFLYASNRGHNSIAIFSIAKDGMLKLLVNEAVQGNWPRNFILSPDGRFLIVANERSDNVTVFKVNTNTGLLTFTGHQLKVGQPVCLKF